MRPDPLAPSAFLNLDESSFSFYTYLPRDRVCLAPEWPSVDLIQLARQMQASESGTGSEAEIDLLSCALLAHGASPLPPGLDWPLLADQLSILYMQQFKRNGNRRLKMKAARANFFLRDLIDLERDESAQVLARRSFGEFYPWDWLPFADGEVMVDSSPALNVQYRKTCGDITGFRLGLPTQVDILAERRLAISSCYSDGWYQWGMEGKPVWQMHSRPVTLAFSHEGRTYYLDNSGSLFLLGTELPLLRLPVTSAWRARYVDGKVFVSDWSEPRRLTVLDPDGWQISIVNSGPVLLTNDLCKVDETFYVIDKMQGRVFSYDANFAPKGERMSFGKGAGCLYDPIALRFHQGNLCVLSWLTGALTEIGLF